MSANVKLVIILCNVIHGIQVTSVAISVVCLAEEVVFGCPRSSWRSRNIRSTPTSVSFGQSDCEAGGGKDFGLCRYLREET